MQVSLCTDRNYKIWASTYAVSDVTKTFSGGIEIFNGNSWDLYLANDPNSPRYSFTSMFIDNKNILWAGSFLDNNGLLKYNISNKEEVL